MATTKSTTIVPKAAASLRPRVRRMEGMEGGTAPVLGQGQWTGNGPVFGHRAPLLRSGRALGAAAKRTASAVPGGARGGASSAAGQARAFSTAASTRSGWNGLTTKSFAPSFTDSRTLDSCPRAEHV